MGAIVTVAQEQTSPFGGARVVSPTTLFALTSEYTNHPLVWTQAVAGGGSVTHDPQNNSVLLRTGDAASGSRAMIETKVYHRYQPGKAQVAKPTLVPVFTGTLEGAAESRAGYYDDDNGVYFGVGSDGPFFAVRTDTSSSPVETRSYQDEVAGHAQWSEISRERVRRAIDAGKSILPVIDLQWLGVGVVRCGFLWEDRITWVHRFRHAGAVDRPYMRTANLPVRFEVINDGAAGADFTQRKVCQAIESDGGVQNSFAYPMTAGTKGTLVSCANSATLTPVMTLRLRDLFGGRTYRGHVKPATLSWLNTATSPAYFETIWNAATLTSGAGAVDELAAGTWTNVDATYSGVERNSAATAYTGGVVIGSGYVVAAGAGQGGDAVQVLDAPSLLTLAREYDNTRDTLTIAARGVGAAATLGLSVQFTEEY